MVFRADLIACDQTSWEELFEGFDALQAITFSGSLEMLLRLAGRRVLTGSANLSPASPWCISRRVLHPRASRRMPCAARRCWEPN
jgi:hypothetical protein